MKNLFSFITLLLILSCSNTEPKVTASPQSSENLRTNYEDMIIDLVVDVQAWGTKREYYISKDSANFTRTRAEGYTSSVSWVPTEDEFTEMFNLLSRNSFRQIKYECDSFMEKMGGSYFNIHVDGKDVEMRDADDCRITDKWWNQYNAIYSGVEEYGISKAEERQKPVKITLADELLTGEFGMLFTINEGSIYDRGDKTLKRDTTFQMDEENNEVYIELFRLAELEETLLPAVIDTLYSFINIPQDSANIFISFKEETLNLSFLNQQ